MDAVVPEPEAYDIFDAFRVLQHSMIVADTSRPINLDIHLEMESQLALRGPDASQETVDALCRDLDAREFARVFASVRNSLCQVQKEIDDVQEQENKLGAMVDDALSALRRLNMDPDDFVAMSNMLGAHRSKVSVGNQLARLHERKADLSARFSKCTGVLKHIRDELVGQAQLPDSDLDGGVAFGTCPICFQEKVQCCLIPCGHSFCQTCGVKAVASCFVCNQPFLNINRLYL